MRFAITRLPKFYLDIANTLFREAVARLGDAYGNSALYGITTLYLTKGELAGLNTDQGRNFKFGDKIEFYNLETISGATVTLVEGK